MKNWKDILIRAGKTFIQGFLGALAVTLPSSDLTDMTIVKSILIGAVAGGVSCVMNMTVQLLERGGKEDEGN